MNSSKPAILIAGTGSGCGKTTVSLGLMAAFCFRGLRVQPFKSGPDFIDPTLHRMVTGKTSYNLDIRMCGADYVQYLFNKKAVQGAGSINIIEGVMGLFDGGLGSGAEIAARLNIPVVLTVNISSVAESVAATVKGFESLDARVNVAAVILNSAASRRHAKMAEEAIKKYCNARVAGYIPRDAEVSIPSRHLGLSMGHEAPLNKAQVEKLGALCSEYIDLELLHDTASRRQDSPCIKGDVIQELADKNSSMPKVRIGIARDPAFCFYYRDNLEMLEACGAELVYFSPLEDSALPENIQGLYIGGGYPELFSKELSENQVMRKEIREFSRSGKPVFAECGGFMYLTDAITGQDGKRWPMAGVYPFESFMNERLRRLGYRRVRLKKDSFLGKRGQELHGHEFHYSHTTKLTEKELIKNNIKQIFEASERQAECYLKANTLAGYVHIHWGKTPEAATGFVKACRKEL